MKNITPYILLRIMLFILLSTYAGTAQSLTSPLTPSIPDEPFTVRVVTTGPYRAPAQIELVASVTHPTNTTITKVEFYNGEILLGTNSVPPYQLIYPDVPAGRYHIQAKAYNSTGAVTTATTDFEVVPSNRYNRGIGTDQYYLSSIIAIDDEQGFYLDGITDFETLYGTNSASYPWFLRAVSSLKNPCNYINYDTNSKTISYQLVNSLPKINGVPIGSQPPLVAFGESGGGTPLYINQDYHFGIAAGAEEPIDNVWDGRTSNDLQIEVYDKKDFQNGATNVQRVFCANYPLPRPNNETSQRWTSFCNEGAETLYFITGTNSNKPINFETRVQYLNGGEFGQKIPFPFLVTHRASNADYYYKISFRGVTLFNNQIVSLAKTLDQSASAWNLSYTLDFEDKDIAPWSTTILNSPHFQGTLLPSMYEGKSINELLHQAPQVKENLPPPKENQFTQLGDSPELKIHSELDKIVEEKGKDPIALANFVQNEIELTDAVGVNVTENTSPFSLNSQGVMRDALATYMEGQGSPIEQCALLIYLLRKAGVPAAYVFPEHDATLMFDEQLSKMLHTQLRGTMTFLGPAPVPELIPINYPWVTAYIDGKWIHLFPWIKDTKVTEGRDLWNYFPSDCNNATKWILKYLYNDPTIRNPWNTTDPDLLSEDNPGTLFPLYAEEQLKKNNLTLNNVGIKFVNQFHNYANWDDFPRPWQTPLITSDNVVSKLDEVLFDTIEIKIFSNRSGKGAQDPANPLLLETGPMRFADLHDRRLLLYHKIIPGTTTPDYTMTLSLEPYESSSENSETIPYTFNKGSNPDPGNLLGPQKVSTALTKNDNWLSYQIITKHHQQVDLTKINCENQFPGLNERTTLTQERPLQKGDMAALSLNYGRITARMKDFELQKYFNYQNQIKADPSFSVNSELATGQILHLMGKSYYAYCSDFESQMGDLIKSHIVTCRAEGLSKLSPERNRDGSPVTTMNDGKLDFNLVYPRVDMCYHHDVNIGNNSTHPDLGGPILVKENDLIRLSIVEGSSQEHRIINEFFNQKSAISTVRLLDIAQGWTPEAGIATTPGANISLITPFNYKNEEGLVNVTQYGISKPSDSKIEKHSLSEWATKYGHLWDAIKNTFLDPQTNQLDPNTILSFSIINQTPVIAPGQKGKPYTGMGAITLSPTGAGALISDSISIDNGGYGGSTTPISSSNPNGNNDFNNQINHWINKSRDDQSWKQIQNQLHAGNGSSDTSSAKNSSPTSGGTLDPISGIISGGPIVPPPPSPSNSSSPALPPAQIEMLQKELANNGFIGLPSYYGKLHNFVKDPVSVVTGEFYINALDLKLNGPMPLELRRIYSSQNQAENNLGTGWKLGTFPYLMLSADGDDTSPPSLIYAAEMDGSVIAYRYYADQKIWKPNPSDNPDLINDNDGSSLESQNLFNNSISKTANDTYLLQGANGTVRTFKIKSFPVPGAPDITRTRPYLETWQDNQGNSYNFSYGTNPKATDYGQLNCITSSNGNNLHFHYDCYGHIVEAFSNDGRRLLYRYDQEGNLVKVTLPDNSVITYAYQKGTHLLTQETKPNGRILKNNYDEARRVITQASTVGVSPVPTTSATFAYNVSGTNADHTINGTTSVTDVSGNKTTYDFTNSQITNISYPESRTVSQTWAGRALASRTDALGLVTTFGYDGQGNLISRSLSGNITGSGSNETAKTTLSYNENNLLTSIIDPIGRSINYAYTDSNHPFNPTSIIKIADGKTISSQTFTYGNFGLPSSQNFDGAKTSYTYNAHGFLTSITQETGTNDPNVTTTVTTNRRGEIVSKRDSQGILKKYDYDALGHQIFDETFDTTGNLVDWHAFYYNENGDLEWEQGARFNPVDYTYYDYDRAGHLIHKGEWLSQAAPDGKSVTSAGLVATSYAYDNQGHCTSITDPNGHVTTMTYDALGDMLSRTWSDGSAQEFFTYEPGGKVATHQTLLGGKESYSYTSMGQISSATHADGTTTSYRYDLGNRLIQVQPSNGPTCDISYTGNAITKTFTASGNSLGSISEAYDGCGNLLEKTDLAGNEWNYTYDGLNRIKSAQSSLSRKDYFYKPGCISWVNANGEWNNIFVDSVGRPLLSTLFNSDGTIAENISNWYSGDHQNVVTTVGSGDHAITTSTWSDSSGHPLIVQHADGSFKKFAYDAVGNLTSFTDEEGTTTSYTYDALNHLSSEILPGGATIKYSCDSVGNLLTRSMPEGLTEQNIYNTAGQKTSSSLIGSDGSTTRNYTYQYQDGLLTSIADPRGFTTSISYDGWKHPTNLTSRGSSIPQQNKTTTYAYDPRGLITSVEQHYNDPSTGPSTLVSRDYDADGQLTAETTSLNGSPLSSWTQTWDAAGRRTALNWNLDKTSSGAQYNFSYNALGEMTSSQNASGTCSYVYVDNGLLSQKSTPSGTTTFTCDNNGNIITATIPDGSTENLTYRADGKIASYAISGNAGNETRNYEYDVRGRLTKEPYLLLQGTNNLSAGTQTASYAFDDLNIRLKQEITADVANVVSEKDSFSQVTLDSLNPDASSPTSWINGYDAQGNLTTHSSDSNNQSLTWDSFGRLVNVTQTNNNTTLNWSTIYDGLGRRIQTTSQGNTINYYYDPEVEFLELGHSVNGNRQWNLYGPDRSGLYGGAQGIGGLESCFSESTKSSFGIVNNYFGDVVGLMSGGNFTPYQSTLGSYGAMPGSSLNEALQPQWRGHYLDPTGFVSMGARYYDPQSGRFISPDPLGHSSSLGLYDYCNGDPVNRLDPDGRCVEGIGAAGSIIASATFGGPAGYVGVNYGTDRLGITDTSSQTAQQQFQYNTQVANLTEATQDTMFALAGARAPVNRISYEPMRFEVGEGEPAIKPVEVTQAGQMEFRFARGASVQTPNVTRAGEAFVRVGATEDSTIARSGSYVMPAATFNFFRRAPDLLKDSFDLPGSVPKYYRYIFPPAGTSIQRGIVPGKEFGGNGGYEEGILWY